MKVAKSMLYYLDSKYSDKSKAYTFKNYATSPCEKTATTVANSKAEGLVIVFNKNFKIELIQYSDLDGYLYTYDAKKNDITVEYDGKFINKGVVKNN